MRCLGMRGADGPSDAEGVKSAGSGCDINVLMSDEGEASSECVAIRVAQQLTIGFRCAIPKCNVQMTEDFVMTRLRVAVVSDLTD